MAYCNVLTTDPSTMAEAGASEKLKVFVSYSRRDSSDFAEELVAGLELAGFAPFLDRHDIVAGEDWEARLGGLIHQADTVVFVVSPQAVKSGALLLGSGHRAGKIEAGAAGDIQAGAGIRNT